MVEIGVKQIVPMVSAEYALTPNKEFKKYTDDALDILETATEASDVDKETDVVVKFFTKAVIISQGNSCLDPLLFGAARRYYDCFSFRMARDPNFACEVAKAALQNERNVKLQSPTTFSGATPVSTPNQVNFDLKLFGSAASPGNVRPLRTPTQQK